MSKSHRSKSSKKRPVPRAPLLEKLSLYSFQRQAVDKMRNYVSAFGREDADTSRPTQGSGLVHMPTGSGKTAVIAALSCCIPEVNSVLILCPRVVLREQLVHELQGNIFEKLSLSLRTIPKKSVHCLSDEKNDGEFLQLPDHAVIVSTIQKLHTIRMRDEKLFRELISRVDLVLFDEGHYEPAVNWSETVRQINKPRIIFTATPFRNDLKLFDVDLQHSYSYSFHKAVSKLTIRGVEMITVERLKSPEEFVDQVIQFYKSLFKQNPGKTNSRDESPRVIIRCDDAAQIRQIAASLHSKRISFVAIHERFKDKHAGGTQWKHVPDPRKTDAVVWIHQYKLLEGVDDSRFQLLAIYGKGPSSVRPLVQQIGRIIRNPNKKRKSMAYVLDSFDRDLENQWSGYLEHDKFVERYGLEALDVNKQLQRGLQEAHPPTLYMDRRFRSRLSLETLRPQQDIQLPLRVNVFKMNDDFNMRRVADTILEEFAKGDRIIADPNLENDSCLILSIRFKNSPYLVDKYFMEAKLCITLVRLAGGYICFFDSGNMIPNDLPGFGSPAPVTELRRMLRGRLSSLIRQVSLINSSMAPHSIHSRTLTTFSSMEHTPPAFDDHAFVCTTADGYVDRSLQGRSTGIRRYVGFGTARLTQGTTAKYHSYAEYQKWLEEVVKILKGPNKESAKVRIRALDRYADVHEPPSETDPRSIVLDFSAVRDSYLTTSAAKTPDQPIEIMQKDVEVKKGKFTVLANGKECEATIGYDELHRKYHLVSPPLDTLYYNVKHEEKSLVQWLNAQQAFRIIPRSNGVVYAGGAFHDPKIGLGMEYADKHAHILGAIHRFPVFKKIQSEKGQEGVLATGSGWEADSLFGLIDRVGGDRLHAVKLSEEEEKIAKFFQNVELLVCDDMGTELADFIMVRTTLQGRKKVVFIHCKALTSQYDPGVSASKLADVCSQAVKNIGELSLFGNSTVDRSDRWQASWKAKNLGTVEKRIRKGTNDSQKAWGDFRNAVEDPNTVREVWLFLGNMLSKQVFQERLKGGKEKKQETMQALYELYSTLTTIRSRDAHFLVFCNP